LKYSNLKKRVLFWFGSASFIILFFFSIAFNYFLNKSINANIKTRLQDRVSFLHNKDIANISEYGVAIIKNNHIVQKNNYFSLKNIRFYSQSKKSFFIIEHPGDDDYIDALYVQRLKDYSIAIYEKNIDNKIENFQDTLLWLVPILLVFIMFLAIKLVDKILLPIRHLTEVIKHISVNDFAQDIPLPSSDDEIKELILSFNSMIHRLHEGVEKLDRFNLDVAHELKTPLTVIRGEIEITLRKPREVHVYENSMSTVLEQTQQIQDIVEQLLFLTKYSETNIENSFEICSLDSLLINAIDSFENTLEHKNIEIVIERIEKCTLKVNVALVNSIFTNLIDNAIKYSSENKKIFLSLFEENHKIHFKIEDQGIGISKQHLKKITDRFYRVDSARNKKIKGFGLGLSIVQQAIFLHKGSLFIDSKEGKGSKIEVVFL